MSTEHRALSWTPLDVAYLGICSVVSILLACAGFAGLAELVGSDDWAIPLLVDVAVWGSSAALIVVGLSVVAAIIQWGTSASRW